MSAMQARCRCGNGVFIVMVEPYRETDKKVTVRYECTLCPRETLFEVDRDDAQAFCDGLGGRYFEPDDGEEDEP